jgi:hypothetical protein
MVGQSTQSLNRFAQAASKAEALCVEITSVLKHLRDPTGSPNRRAPSKIHGEESARTLSKPRS